MKKRGLFFAICIFCLGSTVVYGADTDSQVLVHDFEDLREKGIPTEKLYKPGDEVVSEQFNVAFTITGYEYLDNIYDIDQEWFWDFDNVNSFLNDDGEFYEYHRQTCMRDKETDELSVIEENLAKKTFLKVDISARALNDMLIRDIPMYGYIVYTDVNLDGLLTWRSPEITYRDTDHDNQITFDEMCIGFSEAEYIEDQRDSRFFWRQLNPNELLEYSLIFALDEDFTSNFVIELGALYNDIYLGDEGITAYFLLE